MRAVSLCTFIKPVYFDLFLLPSRLGPVSNAVGDHGNGLTEIKKRKKNKKTRINCAFAVLIS